MTANVFRRSSAARWVVYCVVVSLVSAAAGALADPACAGTPDFDVPGNDLLWPTIPSGTYIDCAEACYSNPQCQAWNWVAGGQRCYIKSAVGPGGYSPGNHWGRKPTTSCYALACAGDAGFSLSGSDLPDSPRSIVGGLATDCARLCFSQPTCKSWVWRASSSACSLKSSVSVYSTDAQVTAGLRPTTPCFPCASIPNYDMPGNDISYNVLADGAYTDCAQLCFTNAACKAWVWREDQKQCWLKSMVSGVGASALHQYGFRPATSCYSCAGFAGIDLPGPSISSAATADGAAGCSVLCYQQRTCKSWTWDAISGCSLKASVGRPSVKTLVTAGVILADASLGCCSSGFSPSGRSCLPCAAGTYSRFGNTTCTSCPAGSFSAAGASACTTCAAGSFSSANAAACSPCAAGSFSASGAAACTSCPTGAFSTGSAAQCTPCSPGFFAATSGSILCSACLKDTFSSAGGAASCSTCPNNLQTLAPASTTQAACQVVGSCTRPDVLACANKITLAAVAVNGAVCAAQALQGSPQCLLQKAISVPVWLMSLYGTVDSIASSCKSYCD